MNNIIKIKNKKGMILSISLKEYNNKKKLKSIMKKYKNTRKINLSRCSKGSG